MRTGSARGLLAFFAGVRDHNVYWDWESVFSDHTVNLARPDFRMDYHLQNLRTGETFALSPQRTLIGTAEHATIRTAEGGPYLAALAVRYPSGWALYGLSNDGVKYN